MPQRDFPYIHELSESQTQLLADVVEDLMTGVSGLPELSSRMVTLGHHEGDVFPVIFAGRRHGIFHWTPHRGKTPARYYMSTLGKQWARSDEFVAITGRTPIAEVERGPWDEDPADDEERAAWKAANRVRVRVLLEEPYTIEEWREANQRKG